MNRLELERTTVQRYILHLILHRYTPLVTMTRYIWICSGGKQERPINLSAFFY